jgi:EAL domain-containing protein (putative c-di-GMP-specific phosphodiesterase class I)
MPFSEMKIDRSFVDDVTTSRDSRAIVKSIIDLAANMDMGCVAEGVETEATAELLEQLGVASLQGYLIGRPMPAEAVPGWLASWTRRGSANARGAAQDLVPELAAPPGAGETSDPRS